MLSSPRQSGPEVARYCGWSPGTYLFRGGKVTEMFSCRPGLPALPNALLIIGSNRARPLSRQGYSGEYLANTPSTGLDVEASWIRFCSFVVRNPARVSDELPTTVKVRLSCSFWSTIVALVTDRLSRTASRSSAAEL